VGRTRPAVAVGTGQTTGERSDLGPDLAARARHENFPVALRVLPARHHADLLAVYAFARTVDELGDGGPPDPAERTARLHRFDAELDRVWTGGPVSDPVLAGLRPAVERHALPAAPFHDLVRANLQDQVVRRYPTYADLREYCRLSADPVGRIVLALFDQYDERRAALSDAICTALQLLEHWQDVGEDHRAGRVYLPLEDLARFGLTEDELAADVAAGTAGEALRALVRFEVDRAAAVLAHGTPLVGDLRGWARPCVAGFVAGGQATVSALRHTGGDVLALPRTPSRARTLARLVALLVRGGR
jgi:squalene synthase HpnC